MTRLPLYTFFQALRKHGFALGVDDYSALLEALNGGFGLEDEQAILHLCRLLWFKPGQSWDLFADQFRRAMQEERQQQQRVRPAAETETTRSLEWENLQPQGATPSPKNDLPDDRASFSSDYGGSSMLEQDVPQPEPQFVHLSIASSAELAGEALPEADQLARHIEQYEFIFQGSYQAISARQLQNSWRYLPDRSQRRDSETISIPQTVDRIARTGKMEEVVFEKESVGRARLLILLDYEGSMVAFHDLADQIAASAPQTLGKIPATYYFHDVPGPQLFRDPDQTQSDMVSQLRPYFVHRKASILIVSDAGAARGRYDRQRVIQTQSALQELQLLGHHIAWLNPVPRARWQGSSAEHIARLLVPMFEVSERGMQQAINVLRGQKSAIHP